MSSTWAQILGGVTGIVVGLVLAALLIWLFYGLPRKRRNSRPSVRFDVSPDRFILADPLARHAGYMSPDMLAELRLRVSDRNQIRNLDGVAWHEAPVPPRRHRCWVQTWGTIDWFTDVYRCPCGAVSRPGESAFWIEKNTRKVSADG